MKVGKIPEPGRVTYMPIPSNTDRPGTTKMGVYESPVPTSALMRTAFAACSGGGLRDITMPLASQVWFTPRAPQAITKWLN